MEQLLSPQSLVAQTIEELTRTIEAISKARQRQFSSRSEAGRYAAQIRWGNRGANATAAQQFVYEGEAEDMQELQRLIGVSQGLVGGLPEETPDIITSDGMTTEQMWTQWETDTDSVSMYEIDGELVPSKRLIAANDAALAVGEQTMMIVEKRRAARGTTNDDLAPERDRLQDEIHLASADMAAANRRRAQARDRALASDDPEKTFVDEVNWSAVQYDSAKRRQEAARLELDRTSEQNAQNAELTVVMQNLGVVGGKPKLAVDITVDDLYIEKPKSSDVTAEQSKGVSDAMAAVATVVPKTVIDRTTLHAPNLKYDIRPSDGLADYVSERQTIYGRKLRTATDRDSNSIIGHEYTHAVQDAIPQVRPLEAAFTARRIRMTFAETQVPFSGQPKGDRFWQRQVISSDSSKGFPDRRHVSNHFGNQYAGANYRFGPRNNFKGSQFGSMAFPTAEVLTTGVQSLVKKVDGQDTADRDHRFWTVGVLLSLPPTATKAVDAINKARERRFSSRSEAGRHAAQIRWGNRSGGSTSVEPPAPTSPYSQIATRCRDAMDAHAAAGFTVETYDAKSLTREKKDELNRAWTTTMKAQYETGDKEDLNRRTNMAIKALEGVSTVGRLTVLRHPSGAIASIGLTYTREGMTTIAFAASSGIMKGSGSAMFGHIVRDTARSGISSLKLDALPTAASFWKEMGFLPVKMKGQLSQMGMPTTIFNEIAGGIG